MIAWAYAWVGEARGVQGCNGWGWQKSKLHLLNLLSWLAIIVTYLDNFDMCDSSRPKHF